MFLDNRYLVQYVLYEVKNLVYSMPTVHMYVVLYAYAYLYRCINM